MISACIFIDNNEDTYGSSTNHPPIFTPRIVSDPQLKATPLLSLILNVSYPPHDRTISATTYAVGDANATVPNSKPYNKSLNIMAIGVPKMQNGPEK